MFIYIGNDYAVEATSIISILDMQLKKTSTKLQRIIEDSKIAGTLLGEEKEAKSIVITDDQLYYSPLSTLTLKKSKTL